MSDEVRPKRRRFLSKKDVREKVSLSYAQIARLEAEGRFPKRIYLPGVDGKVHHNSRAVWLEDLIEAWMDEQIAKAAR